LLRKGTFLHTFFLKIKKIMKFFIHLFFIVVVFVACMGAPVFPFSYPLFHQCDPQWSSNIMGVVGKDNITICEQGCAMSCVSMSLAGHKIVDPLNPAVRFHSLAHRPRES
jgi:hypothetical protein